MRHVHFTMSQSKWRRLQVAGLDIGVWSSVSDWLLFGNCLLGHLKRKAGVDRA